MKTSLLILSCLLLCSAHALADDSKPTTDVKTSNDKSAEVSNKEANENAEVNPNSDTSKDLKENLDQGLHIEKKPKVDFSKEVRGICEVVITPTHPITEACVSTLLILKDPHGKEVARTRTDGKGNFDFAADPAKKFKIVPAAAAYDLVAPQHLVSSGSTVHLKLKLHP
jgi:hypothetical protein